MIMKYVLILLFIPQLLKSQNTHTTDSYIKKIKIQFELTDSALLQSIENTDSAQAYLLTLNKTFTTHLFSQGKIDTAYLIRPNNKNKSFKLGLLSIRFGNQETCLKADQLLKKKRQEDAWDDYMLLSHHTISNQHLIFIYSSSVNDEKIKVFFKTLNE